MFFSKEKSPHANPEEKKRIIALLDNATEKDFKSLKKDLSDYLNSVVPAVVVSALNYISRCKLIAMHAEVLQLYHHETPLIRMNVLQTLYDLHGDKVFSLFEQGLEDSNPAVKLTAKILIYLIKKDPAVLEKIKKDILDDYDYYYLSYTAMNTFEAYLNLKNHPEIISLIQVARDAADKDSDFYADATNLLDDLE